MKEKAIWAYSPRAVESIMTETAGSEVVGMAVVVGSGVPMS